jgi:hypothetical protein
MSTKTHAHCTTTCKHTCHQRPTTPCETIRETIRSTTPAASSARARAPLSSHARVVTMMTTTTTTRSSAQVADHLIHTHNTPSLHITSPTRQRHTVCHGDARRARVKRVDAAHARQLPRRVGEQRQQHLCCIGFRITTQRAAHLVTAITAVQAAARSAMMPAHQQAKRCRARHAR